jgi:hypothetical protein
MATRNLDGSVTVKTTGKVAQNPSSGTGTGVVKSSAAKTNNVAGPKVVKTTGRGPVPRTRA